MRFAIYIPGDDINNEQKLVAVGLSHLVSGAMGLGASPGPDGKRGIVFSWPQDGSPVGYFPDRQKWIPAKPKGDLQAARYWVGFGSTIPTPFELEWPKRFGGYWVELGDGNQWCIPSAGELPQVLRMGDDGRAKREVRKQYESYFNDSVKWFADFITRDFSELTQEFDTEVFCYIERALSLNYRLTPEVVSELELLGTDNILTCLRASVDGIQIAEELVSHQKKSMTHHEE